MLKRMKFLAGGLATAAIVGSLLARAADPPSAAIAETNVLMRAKLSSSQKVLEGLLAENYILIQQGAREMKRISAAAEWPRSRDTVYEHHAAEFRRLCSKLEDLARKQNHEGASFTYLQMTTGCIDCHNYVRDALRIADQEDGGVQLIPTHIPE